MSVEFEDEQEPKNLMWLLWLGVLALLGAMVAALWISNRGQQDVTQVRAKHLLVQCEHADPVDRAGALERAKELRRRIEQGDSFSKLAKEYSADAFSSARGGDLGYYPRGKFEKDFEAYVWNAPIGQLSEPIQTGHGFHLIVVVDRHISEADRYEMELERKARDAERAAEPQESPTSAP